MWPKSMQLIVASIAKKYWQKIMKIGEILKQMYFRGKPSHSAVSSQPAKPVSVCVCDATVYSFGQQSSISRTAEIK